MSDIQPKNVLGTKLKCCSKAPLTGFFRDGYCKTNSKDRGSHVVASIMTENFLNFTKTRGNDLTTPNPVFNFPGLREGDRWCLCALRWKEALINGYAPKVLLEATNEKTLEVISIDDLIKNSYTKK